MRFYQERRTFTPDSMRFIFATGIECSYPTIETPAGRRRVDQLEKCGHYEHWREDLRLVDEELNLRFLRYGPPYYRIHIGPDKFDWSFTDEVMNEMRRRNLVPILDLCHFGVPDWIGDFQNPEFPRHFTDYVRAFARRYPWVWCYTPINEMYITAAFSAYRGIWNERLKSDRAFVTAIKHLARAATEAMLALIEIRSDCIFVLAESSERTHTRSPKWVAECELHNDRRFLTLDLICGRAPPASIYQYMRDNGVTEDEYLFFYRYDLREHIIIGHDYYSTNEFMLDDNGERADGDSLGYYAIATQYHARYGLPVMLTETNARVEDSVHWLWRTWTNVQQLRHEGMPLCGMTWYSLTDQMDWDTTLAEDNQRLHPVGLFDLDRQIRPVGREYKKLIQDWHDLPLVPNGPLTLVGDWGTPDDDVRG